MFKIPLFGLSSVFYTSCTKKEPYLFIGKTHKFKNSLNLMTLDHTLSGFFFRHKTVFYFKISHKPLILSLHHNHKA